MKEKEKVKWDTKLEFVERRFLNKSNYHSTSSVVGKISGEEYSSRAYCEFYISDCNRTISLDIDSDDLADLENSIFKMEQLIEVASKMKEALEKLKPYIKKVKEEELREKKEREAKKLNKS